LGASLLVVASRDIRPFILIQRLSLTHSSGTERTHHARTVRAGRELQALNSFLITPVSHLCDSLVGEKKSVVTGEPVALANMDIASGGDNIFTIKNNAQSQNIRFGP
jgi:hypothetical protein